MTEEIKKEEGKLEEKVVEEESLPEIRYEFHSARELGEELKEEFIEVFNTIFNVDYNLEWFDWKYCNSIYGDSYLVLAFDGGKLIGIRGFWRNDIEGESYQPCDTGVLREYRGRGVFTKSSKVALEHLDKYFIYNFPNENSYPGYLKIGWKLRNNLYLKTVFSKKNLKKETLLIEDEYLEWRFVDNPINKYYYCKKGNEYYLLINRIRNIYYVLGRFDEKYKDNFTEANKPILFNYSDEETFMYKLVKNKANVVMYDNGLDVEGVPIFKADFF